MSKSHFVLGHIIILGLLLFSLYNIFNAFQTQGSLKNTGKDLMVLIVFLPIELAIVLKYFNNRFKSLSLALLIKLITDSIPLMLGLFILFRGISIYIDAGYKLSVGQNVAPVILLISGAVLSLIGVGALVIKK